MEAQLVNYHASNQNDGTFTEKDYKFLNPKIINQYDDLFELFHEVLAVKNKERDKDLITKFSNLPYLNSSLFELSEIEKKTIDISSLKDRFKLPFYKNTIFSNAIKVKDELLSLEYLLLFLDAYDFASEGTQEIIEEHKTIINASVLGLIFEKINGYKEGSFYTPGFITMYMARESIRRAVVQKFNYVKRTSYKDFAELKRNISRSPEERKEANKVINTLKICDPAVGSGHFLVSCLNEIIAVKADLGILCYKDGRQVQNYLFEIENDELIITNEETDEIFNYRLNPSGKPILELQNLQEALFHEKETIIENCLFGVDINSNSVNICRLRLWIELLKNSYYTKESNYTELETLPNIDINIKQGNSLISRFKIDQNIFTARDRKTLELYKVNVAAYKNASDKESRRKLKISIDNFTKAFKGLAVDPLRKEKDKLSKLAEELHELNKKDLFTHELTEEHNERIEQKRNLLVSKIEKLKTEIETKEEEYKGIFNNAFEWRFEFPEVLDEEGNFVGFDVVIGNPPYGRYTGISNSIKNYYKNNRIYGSTGDIAEFFINRMVNHIVNCKTQFTFIVPKGLSYVNSWKSIRKRFLDDFNIYGLIDTSNAFDEALYEMMIFHIILSESKDINIKCGYLKKSSSEIFKLERTFYSDRLFYLGFPQNSLTILEKVNNNSMPVRNLMNYWYGKGGLTPFTNKKDGILLLTGKEILPYAFKKDIERWYITKTFLNEDDLMKRKIEKVVVQDIVAHILYPLPHIKIIAALDMEQRFCLNTVMCFAEKDKLKNKTLLALLNSKLISFYYYYFIFNQAIRTMHFMPGYADELPVAKNIFDKQESLIKLVNQILTLKKENPKTDTTALEKQIDDMVYKLYGLTEEEIKIVEGG